jgi:hypothetical protein
MSYIYPWLTEAINYFQTLSPMQIWVIIGFTALVVLYITYRLLGFSAAVALLIAYLLAYAIYANNLYGFYKKNANQNNQNMNTIQKEIDK